MADKSRVSYVDATWPIVVGCTPESPGCVNCWAVRDAWRMAHNPNSKISGVYRDLVGHHARGGFAWAGEVRTVPERLDWPLHWLKPRVILVSSHGDLCHEAVPTAFILAALEVMVKTKQHTYIFLTKRPERMHEVVEEFLQHVGHPLLPANIICATSAEDQERLDERWRHLKAVPATRQALSLEPLLGPIDLSNCLPYYTVHPQSFGGRTQQPRSRETAAALGAVFRAAVRHLGGPVLSWVIVGCESGPHARPMEDAWVENIRDQCREAGVPMYYKQMMVGKTLVKLPSLHGKAVHMLPGDRWPEEASGGC